MEIFISSRKNCEKSTIQVGGRLASIVTTSCHKWSSQTKLKQHMYMRTVHNMRMYGHEWARRCICKDNSIPLYVESAALCITYTDSRINGNQRKVGGNIVLPHRCWNILHLRNDNIYIMKSKNNTISRSVLRKNQWYYINIKTKQLHEKICKKKKKK